jgi:predicted MFS family arabinose efflux permease
LAGALLISAYGLAAPFLALTAVWVASLALTYRIREPTHDGQPATARVGVRRQLIDGLAVVRENSSVAWLLALAFLLITGLTVLPVIPIYARDVLDVGESGFAWLIGGFAAGQGAAALVLAVSGGPARKGLAVVFSAVLWSGGVLVFGFSQHFLVSLAAMAVMGVCAATWVSSLVTLLQIAAPREKLGRVMALYVLSLQTASLAWLIGGWMGQALGNRPMLLITATAFAGANLLALALAPVLRGKTPA